VPGVVVVAAAAEFLDVGVQAVQLAGLTSKICASDKNIKIAGAVEEGARLIAGVTDIRMPEGY